MKQSLGAVDQYFQLRADEVRPGAQQACNDGARIWTLDDLIASPTHQPSVRPEMQRAEWILQRLCEVMFLTISLLCVKTQMPWEEHLRLEAGLYVFALSTNCRNFIDRLSAFKTMLWDA